MVKRLSWLLLLFIPALAVISLSMGAAHGQHSVAQLAPDPTCSGSSPCIEYQNTGTGQGLEGVGKSAAGLVGESTSGNGVYGTSTSGNGVLGRLGSASGISSPGAGVRGDSLNYFGVTGTSVKSSGVLGVSTNEFGVDAVSTNGIGVWGVSTNSIGVEGSSSNFVGVDAVGGFDNETKGLDYPALSIVGDTSCTTSPCSIENYLIEACPSGTANPCDSNNSVFVLDQNGDIDISGDIYTAGSCSSGCIAHNSVKQAVRFYTPRESLPTVEDFGEAQLTAGHAFVRIDPAFADTIDQQSNYLVFITPEGDSNVLFVSQKSGSGFAVTESRGGRDSIAFQYRIVAKPYGENAPRLQRFTIHLPRPSLGINTLRPGTVAPVH
jgi:hypothetical protein